MKNSVALFALIVILLPGTAAAQGSCTLLQSTNLVSSNLGTPQQTMIITGGSFSCPGGKRLSADQIGTNEATGIMTLSGNVRFSDPDKTVTATTAQYYRSTGVLQATGNVVVTDVETRSQLRAPGLNYRPASGRSAETHMVTNGGRARAVIRSAPRTAPDLSASGGAGSRAARRDSSIVDANVIELIGERDFRGIGSAIITRPDMRGFGDFVEYAQDEGEMLLANNARVESEKYTLTADSIRAFLSEGDEVSEVRAINNSDLTAEEIQVLSPFLTIKLESGEVNRLIATRPRSTEGAPASLPQILSASFNLSADSIDALAPGQQLERVDAVGNAYGERIDTLPPPPQAAELPRWLTNDWLRGDVLVAEFGVDSTAVGEPEQVLRNLLVTGQPASATLRMHEPADSTWEFHHTLANRITVVFLRGQVADLQFEGNVQGIYLSPPSRAARSPGGDQ